MMKRLAFWKTDAANPQKFTVTLGELRDSMRLARDPKTDHYEVEVPYRLEDVPEQRGEQGGGRDVHG